MARKGSTVTLHGKEHQDRRDRMRARYNMEKEGRVKPNDGKEVDHIKPLRSGGSSAKSNLRVISMKANRTGRPKGT